MLDFSFDATVTLKAGGRAAKLPLTIAMLQGAQLLAVDRPFGITSSEQQVYCTYDGERLYADTRIATMLEAIGVSFYED